MADRADEPLTADGRPRLIAGSQNVKPSGTRWCVPEGSASGPPADQPRSAVSRQRPSERRPEQDRVEHEPIERPPPRPEHRLVREQHDVAVARRLLDEVGGAAEEALGVLRPGPAGAEEAAGAREDA